MHFYYMSFKLPSNIESYIRGCLTWIETLEMKMYFTLITVAARLPSGVNSNRLASPFRTLSLFTWKNLMISCYILKTVYYLLQCFSETERNKISSK